MSDGQSARQPRLRPPPPPCSHAFLDVSISLMSQWFYGRTAGLERKCLTAASPTPTPSRLPSVSGCFHLIDVPMAIWQDWIKNARQSLLRHPPPPGPERFWRSH
ncbi:hypothetical protein MAR_017867 [Mya arenaria]|uniref:Uncharacterized protein n=1 Tax=Mya arenaria TaxID=6604 RepID=A0ABY7EHN9_MYAAR|nr:hypothetical protein MAR_017867 [Mya arenaria]